MSGNKLQCIADPTINVAKPSIANVRGALEDCLENRFQVSGRGTDKFENLGSGCKLLHRLVTLEGEIDRFGIARRHCRTASAALFPPCCLPAVWPNGSAACSGVPSHASPKARIYR